LSEGLQISGVATAPVSNNEKVKILINLYESEARQGELVGAEERV
jgi:hypothetical protein